MEADKPVVEGVAAPVQTETVKTETETVTTQLPVVSWKTITATLCAIVAICYLMTLFAKSGSESMERSLDTAIFAIVMLVLGFGVKDAWLKARGKQ